MSQEKNTSKKILVAMSGGVDSSVAAYLLREQGHEVAGATIRTWASENCDQKNTRSCCGLSGVEDARDVADDLEIPYWVFNFEKEFKTTVVDHFVQEYLSGRTPNPCISCNEHIKFRLFWERAKQMGFDGIATGHHAQVGYDAERETYFIQEGADVSKDQSYVLFPLSQEILRHLYLPVGNFSKKEIREIAKQKKLRVWDKQDSQEICFIPSNDYGTFIQNEFLKGEDKPGIIRMKDGSKIGEHDGFFHYTRGQRRGLRVPYQERLYVIHTDREKNEVVVGTKQDICDQGLMVKKPHWFLPPEEAGPLRVEVKIRSQHTKAPALLKQHPDGSVSVNFDEPQEAITPGQGAVFYEGSRVLGGGWIDSII